MLSPERNDSYHDEDLSTLSNIRMNNRRSKQRLRDQFKDETNTIDFILGDSPTKTKYPSHLRNSYIPSSSSISDEDHSFDSKILNKENQIYSNNETFKKNSKINDLKRDRILKSLKSPNFRKNSPLVKDKLLDITEDVFYNSDLNSNIPDLNPRRPFTSPSISKFEKKLNQNIDHQEKNFEKLLSKYNLKNDNEEELTNYSKINELQKKIRMLEDQLRTKSNNQSTDRLSQKNLELTTTVKELNEYVEFIELNFDKVYKKMSRFRKENKELIRVNNELSKLNEKYRDILKNKPVNVSEDIKTLKTLLDNDETSTYQLLNLNFK